MSSPSPNYHAYLLRLWREHANAPWRVSLQSAETRKQHHFANLAALFAFLEAQTEQPWLNEITPNEGNQLPSETNKVTGPM